MARIELDSSLVSHPKTYRLMSNLGVDGSHAVGLLAVLWLWSRDHKPDGNLGGMNDAEIALAAGWRGDAGKLVKALLYAPDGETGFLERRDQSLWIHDAQEWLPKSEKQKLRRRTDVDHKGHKSGPRGPHAVRTGESLVVKSLHVSKETTTKTTTKDTATEVVNSNTKIKPPHVELVDRFKALYEKKVGQPFKNGKHQFVIASRLIKDHGIDAVVAKAQVLAVMCRDRSSWFTKSGWADFSVEKLSSQWNALIPEAIQPSKDQDFAAELFKRRAANERVDQLLGK